MLLKFIVLTVVVGSLVFSSMASAQTEPPQFMTVDGRLYDSTTPEDPLLDNSVLMKIQILNPAKTCILYEEEQTVSTLSSNGYFNVRVGSPTSGAESLKRTTATIDVGNSMMQIFQNQNASIAGKTAGGAGCGYTPASGDTRYFRFVVTPSTTGVTSTLSPDMQIDSVPQSLVAETLQGMSPDDFVQINSDVTQAKVNTLFGASYTTLSGLLAGSSSLYLQNTTNGTVIPNRATNPASPTAGQIWYDSDDFVLRYYDGTSVLTLGTSGGDPTKLPLAGGTMSGAIDMATNDITDVGHITQAPQRTFRFGVYTTVQQATLVATPLIAGHEGTVWYNTTTNKLMFWDGTAEFAVSPVDSVFGRTGAVVATASDYDADQIDNTAAGNIAATDVQAAINELDTEKVAKAGDTMTGALTMNAQNQVRLADAAGGEYAAIQAPATIGANYVLTLPDTDGDVGQVLSTDGSGVLSWIAIPSAPVTSVFGRTGVVAAAASDYDANQVDNTAAGNIASTDVQAAINELDTEKVPTTRTVSAVADSGLSGGGDLSANRTFVVDIAGTTALGAAVDNADEVLIYDVSGSVRRKATRSEFVLSETEVDAMVSDNGYLTAEADTLDSVTGRGASTANNVTLNAQADLRLADAAGGEYAAIQAPATIGANYVLTLPDTDGDVGQVLSTDGSGVLSWIAIPSAPVTTVFGRSGAVVAAASDYDANQIDNTAAGNIAATDVQAAINELDSEKVAIAGDTMTGALNIDNEQELRLSEADGSGSNYVAIKALTTLGANYTLTLPANDGDSGQYLQTDGNGILAWVTPAGVGETNTASNQGAGGVGVFKQKTTFDLEFRNINAASNKISVALDAGNNEIDINVAEANLDLGTIPNTPAGAIAATTAQTAINELDTEKVAKTGDSMTGALTLSAQNQARFADSAGGEYAAIQAPATIGTNYVLTLPDTAGSASQVLTTNGSGVLSWTTPSSTPGADTLDFTHFSDTMTLDASTDISATGTNVLSITNSGTGDSFRVYDQAADTSPFVIDQSGNVGIGTTAPGATLEIGTNTASSSAFRFVASTAQQGATRFVTNPAANWIQSGVDFTAGSAKELRFSNMNGSTTWMTISTAGSLGVGTVTPGTLLDVAGAITSRPNGTATGETGQLIMRELAAGGTDTVAIRAPDAITTSYALTLPDTAGTSGQVLSTDGTGLLSWVSSLAPAADSLDFTHFSDTMALDASTDIAADNAEVLSITNTGTGNSFLVNDAAGDASPFVIDASGNVGIGTTAPVSTLDVNGVVTVPRGLVGAPTVRFGNDTTSGMWSGSANTLNFAISSANIFQIQSNLVLANRPVQVNNGATAGTPAFSFGLDNDTGMFNPAADTIGFSVGSSEKMRIDSSGNVGIGTTIPGTILDASGAITSRPFGTATGETGQLIMRELAAGGTDTVAIRAPDAITTNYALTLPTTAGSSGQVLSTDGTGLLSWVSSIAPAADSLDFTHFADSMTLDASTDIAATGTNALSVTNSGTGDSFRVNDASGDTSPFVIDNSGQVGIGTTAAGRQLHVLASGSSYARIERATQGGGEVGIELLGGTGGQSWAIAQPVGGDDLTFYRGGERMRIGANGGVGIGTTVPGTILDAAGAITSRPSGIGTGQTGQLIMRELAAGGTDTVAIRAPDSVGTSFAITLPDTAGTSGQVLSTDGTGLLSWVSSLAPTADSLDFTHFSDTMALDASTDIAADNAEVLSITNTGTGNSFLVNDVGSDTSPFVIDASGNVGIGTSSPATSLDIVGGIQSSGVAGGLTLPPRGGAGHTYQIYNSAGIFSLWSSFTGGPQLVMLAAGNVGIGTTAPGTLLDIAGAMTSRPFGTATGETGQMIMRELAAGGTDTVAIRAPDAIATSYSLTLPDTAGSASQVLTTNGSGVLSWTTPSSGAALSGLTAAAATNTIANTNYAQAWNWDTLTTQTAMSMGTTSGTTGTLLNLSNSFNSATSTGNVLKIAATGTSNAAVPLMLTNAGTGNSFRVNDDGTDTDASPFLIDATGNVGIGTTTPTARLSIAGTMGDFATSGIAFGDGDTGFYETSDDFLAYRTEGVNRLFFSNTGDISSNTGHGFEIDNQNTVTFAPQSGDSDTGLGGPAVDNVGLYTAGAERVRVDSSGNIGIGTTAPGTLLDVAGAVTSRPNGTGTGQTGQLIMRELAAGGTDTVAIRAPDAITTSYALTLPGTAGSASQVLTTDGAGVLSWTTPSSGAALSGLTAAAATNTIANTNYAQAWNWDTLTTQTAMSMGTNSGTTGTLLNLTNSFNSATSTGNVLKIAATGASNAAVPLMLTNAGTGNSLRVNDDGTDTDTTPFVVDASGNVGIGTTVPGTILDVAGAITSRPYGAATGETGQILMRELAASGTNTAKIRSPDTLAADYVLTLPVDDGTAGQVLSTDGSGALSWVSSLAPATDSLDFTHLSDTMTLDASTDIAATGTNVLSITNSGTGNSFLVNDAASDTTPFVIDNAGKVGIGVAAPTEALEVNGNIYATDITAGGDLIAGGNISADSLSVGTIGAYAQISSGPWGAATGETGQLILFELAANGIETATIRAPDAITTSYALTLPTTAGTSGQVLSTDGTGILSWVSSLAPAADSLDFTHFADAMILDASTDIAASGTNVLSITNSGTGNSFLVNDQSADTTPFVIDASGNVGIGTTTATTTLDVNGVIASGSGSVSNPSLTFRTDTDTGFYSTAANSLGLTLGGTASIDFSSTGMTISRKTNNTFAYGFDVERDRAGSIVQSGDGIGAFSFKGYDGGAYRTAAQITGIVDATPGASDMPGALVFLTTPDGSATTTEKMRINSAGNIGIGTTSPGTIIDAAGAITSRPYGTATGETGQLIMRELAAGGTDTVAIRAPDAITTSYSLTLPGTAGAASQVLTTNGSGVLSWSTPSTSVGADSLNFTDFADAMTLDASTDIAASGTNVLSITNTGTGNSFLVNDQAADTTPFVIDASGQVGVGTATPGANLHMYSGSNTVLSIDSPSGWNQSISFQEAGAETWSIENRGSTDELIFWTGSGAQRMWLDYTGNLQIDNEIRLNDADDNHYVGFVSPATVAADILWTLPSADGTSGQVLQTDGSGVLTWATVSATPADDSLNFDKFSDTMTLDASTDIAAAGTNVLSITNSGTGDSFRVNDATGDTSPFVIDASGNVGVGTTAPTSSLDVVGVATASSGFNIPAQGSVLSLNGTSRFRLWNSWTEQIGDFVINSSGAPRLIESPSVTNPAYGFTSDSNTGVYNPAADSIGFVTAGSEKIRLDSSGNVGIGTTSPGTIIDVAGAITSRPNGTGTGQTGQLILRELAASGTNTATIRSPDTLAADYVLTLPVDDGTANQVLQTDGSGALSWANALVSGGTFTAGAGTVSAPTLSFSGDTNTGFYNPYDGGVQLTINGTNSFLFDANGMFGTQTGGAKVLPAAGTAGIPTFSFAGDEDTGWFRAAANEMAASTGGTERVRIDSSGNIGIGTTTPGAKLDVAGDIMGVTFYGANLNNSKTDSVAYAASSGATNYSVVGPVLETYNMAALDSSASFLSLKSRNTNGNYQNAYIASVSNTGAGVYAPSIVFGQSTGSAAYNERMRLDASGNLGIGTTAPASKLQVSGAITNTVTTFSAAFTCGTSTLDFSTSNFQRLSPSGAIAAGSCNVGLTNLVAGGSYTLVVTGNAATNAVTYNFTGYTFKYLPTNAATTAAKDSIYTFIYDGTTVYVTWSGGY